MLIYIFSLITCFYINIAFENKKYFFSFSLFILWGVCPSHNENKYCFHGQRNYVIYLDASTKSSCKYGYDSRVYVKKTCKRIDN